MSDIAISAEGLGKEYQIGARRAGYRTLREAIHAAAAGAARFGRELTQIHGRTRRTPDSFWALKNVSFEIKRGEVVGIVGRNGAGKSTLLKLLSRITEPTKGHADIAGTVGSLLEVGTGFHPELSGRENIYLNGTILGMRRQEIERKFDAIVEFAEVAQFIDTPVKRYSSGMYLRLAFAVAAYLEPEILLVDEVLAVGDAAFRKKCLGKMDSVAKQGRTVLFVSHDMTAVNMLCQTALLLSGGQVERAGRANEVVDFYLEKVSGAESAVVWDSSGIPSDAAARLLGVSAARKDGAPAGTFSISDSVHLTLDFELRPPGSRINPVFVVHTLTGMTLFSTSNYDEPHWGTAISSPGLYRATCQIPANLFAAGTYLVDVMLVEETRFVRASADSAVSFQIHDDGSGRGDYVGEWKGVIRPRCIWETGRA